MSRCAACGSKSVAYGTKNEGFSVGKAVAGTIFFGPVGAVAGTAGKKTGYYHCGACGSDLGYCMSNFAEEDINNALADPVKHERTLIRYKQRYCNIEWNPSVSAPASVKSEAPKDNCSAIISRINSRTSKEASIREKAALLYKFCLENQISSFPINDENFINQLFGEITQYLQYFSSKKATSLSKRDFEKTCELAKAYGYIAVDGDVAKVSQNKVDIAGAKMQYLKNAEINLIEDALYHQKFIEGKEIWSGVDYINGVMSEAFNGKDSMTPEELQCEIALILEKDGLSTDMTVLEGVSQKLIFVGNYMSRFIWDNDQPKGQTKEKRESAIIEKKNGVLTLIKKAERTRGYSFAAVNTFSLDFDKNEGQTLNTSIDRTDLEAVLDLLNPDIIFDECKGLFKGDKEYSFTGDLLGNAYSIACHTLGILESDIPRQLSYEGALEKTVRSMKSYYTLPGGFRRNQEKQAREQAIANNNAINAQIAQLNNERANQSRIYEEFKSKIFGEGARKKKEALARINAIDAEIAALKTKIQRV